MRWYGNLDYFKSLNFTESLHCYIHLKNDLDNQITVEKVTMLINSFLGREEGEVSEVDGFIDEFF